MVKFFISIMIALGECIQLFPQVDVPKKEAGSMVSYLTGRDSVTAYLVMPEGEGSFPAVILIHEWWGLNKWVKNNADEFARKGYIALAIDLYRGNVTDNPETAHEYSRALDQDQGVRDLSAAYNYLIKVNGVDSSRLGSIGWCMGGMYALQSAIHIPDLKAAVVCYGGLVKDPEMLRKINASVLGIFGEDDKGIPPSSVKEFEAMMKKEGKEVEIHIYPKSGHGFMNKNNTKGYAEESTTKAWREIWSFFTSNLKEQPKK